MEFKPGIQTISYEDFHSCESSQTTSDMVSFKMMDRNGNVHQLQAAVLDEVTKIFDKKPYEFSKIDNQVDILLRTVKISIVLLDF